MGIKKDIGHGLKEQFENLRASPNESVWTGIEVKLVEKKRKRRFLLLWFFATISLGVILISLFLTSDFSSNPIKNREQNTRSVDGQESIEVSKHSKETYSGQKASQTKMDSIEALDKLSDSKFESVDHNNLTTNSDSQGDSVLKTENQLISKTKSGRLYIDNKKTKSKLNKPNTNKSSNGIISNSKSAKIVEQNIIEETYNSEDNYSNQSSKKLDSFSNKDDASKRDSNENILAGSQTLKDSVQETTNNKDYELEKKDKTMDSIEILKDKKWSVFPNVSLISYNAFGKSFTDKTSMNYGIYFTYLPSNKLSLRFGINKFDLKQTSKNTIGDIIIQEVSYLEVPIELKYAFIDRNIRISAIGGFSFLLLHDAKYFRNSESDILTINNKSDFTKSNLSMNAGFEIQSKLFKKFYINLQPSFKYQVVPYKSNLEYHPYTISITTGIEYKF